MTRPGGGFRRSDSSASPTVWPARSWVKSWCIRSVTHWFSRAGISGSFLADNLEDPVIGAVGDVEVPRPVDVHPVRLIQLHLLWRAADSRGPLLARAGDPLDLPRRRDVPADDVVLGVGDQDA